MLPRASSGVAGALLAVTALNGADYGQGKKFNLENDRFIFAIGDRAEAS
jgi:hypothetical protein